MRESQYCSEAPRTHVETTQGTRQRASRRRNPSVSPSLPSILRLFPEVRMCLTAGGPAQSVAVSGD